MRLSPYFTMARHLMSSGPRKPNLELLSLAKADHSVRRLPDHKARGIVAPPIDVNARRTRLGLLQHSGREIQPGDTVTTARQFDGMPSGAAGREGTLSFS